MNKFYCTRCKNIFEAEGIKKEWIDSLYGPCWKIVAKCPLCNSECDEYRASGSSKKEKTLPSCGCSL